MEQFVHSAYLFAAEMSPLRALSKMSKNIPRMISSTSPMNWRRTTTNSAPSCKERSFLSTSREK